MKENNALTMLSFSTCCLGHLPVVRRPEEALRTKATFTTSMAPLVDALKDTYQPSQIQIIKSRYLAIIDSAERDAVRSDWWDTKLFLLGFGGSLLVTIAAAIGQAGYMTSQASTIVSTLVLIMSSIGTAALGLRERLKFREAADISKRLSAFLQMRGFMFLTASGKYADMPSELRFQTFITDVETFKLRADREHQALRTQDEGGQMSMPGPSPVRPVLPTTLQNTSWGSLSNIPIGTVEEGKHVESQNIAST